MTDNEQRESERIRTDGMFQECTGCGLRKTCIDGLCATCESNPVHNPPKEIE